MQCQICGKPATVHLTEIVNGQKLERHFCEQCAQKEGITIKAQIPISDILTNLMEAQQEARQLTDMVCPNCQISWGEFRKRGLLGCPNDYIAFGEALEHIIERAQDGALKHIGKVPSTSKQKQDNQLRLLQLRKSLQQAVKEEAYETAARIRDEISQLAGN